MQVKKNLIFFRFLSGGRDLIFFTSNKKIKKISNLIKKRQKLSKTIHTIVELILQAHF